MLPELCYITRILSCYIMLPKFCYAIGIPLCYICNVTCISEDYSRDAWDVYLFHASMILAIYM